jgi:putative endonuclease
MKGGWVYIKTNGPHGTLSIGVTADIVALVTRHCEGRGSEFCAEHDLTRLAYAERHEDIHEAIVREKRMKFCKRLWMVRLIRMGDPEWRDLYDELNA